MKINLGCGSTKIKGFVNVDVYEPANPDVVDSAQHYLTTLSDDSVDLIVMSHVIQCMNEQEIYQTMMEVIRVLKMNGELLIAIPDHGRIVKAYEKGMINPGHLNTLVLGVRNHSHNVHVSVWTQARLEDTMRQFKLYRKKTHQKHRYIPGEVSWQWICTFSKHEGPKLITSLN